jgi:hypothetical protein
LGVTGRMFYMSWSRRIATTCPLIPLVIAYLPVQTVLTLLHGYLLNGNAAMDSKGMDINSNVFYTPPKAWAATIRALIAQKPCKRASHNEMARFDSSISPLFAHLKVCIWLAFG